MKNKLKINPSFQNAHKVMYFGDESREKPPFKESFLQINILAGKKYF